MAPLHCPVNTWVSFEHETDNGQNKNKNCILKFNVPPDHFYIKVNYETGSVSYNTLYIFNRPKPCFQE